MGFKIGDAWLRKVHNLPFSWWADKAAEAKEWSDEKSAEFKEIKKQLDAVDEVRFKPYMRDIEESACRVECVYFARCGSFVKIGKSSVTGVNFRITELQVGNPFIIVLVGMVTVGRGKGLRAEKALHAEFKDYHHRGEWFHYEGSFKKFVNDFELQRAVLREFM